MNIIILNKSKQPIYEQIYEQIAAQILNGELEANSPLPSIRAIARELGVSIVTVKQAWELLERGELIYTRMGKGCFVSEHVENQLDDKKFALATDKLKKDIPYYKNLNITLEELIELIKEEY